MNPVLLILLIALTYLLVIRSLDVHEKEPGWALLTFFGTGLLAGLLTHLAVPSSILVLDDVWGPFALELTTFVAFGISFLVISGVERLRGWPEIDGVMDGIVYGVATGLGVAVGGIIISQVMFSESLFPVSAFDEFWTVALFGSSAALFGGIVGAGFGYGRARGDGNGSAWAAGFAGFAFAVVAHILHQMISNAPLDSSAGLARAWFGLLLPVLALAVLIFIDLGQERRLIKSNLAGELEGVPEPSASLVGSLFKRRRHYLGLFASGRFEEWKVSRALQNHLMELAFLKQSEAARHPQHRIQSEIAAVRAEISHLSARLGVLTRSDQHLHGAPNG